MENANANVQSSQPDPSAGAPAVANGATPPVSTSQSDSNAAGASQTTDPGAGEPSKPSMPSFDPEIQKFLDNQNIKTDDLAAAVTELAKRNMKLRGKADSQSVAEVLAKPAPTTPSVADTIQQAQQSQQPQQPAPQSHTLSDMDIANVSMYVKSQYPDVTADAEFYKAMIADGFKPTTADGQINLKGVLSYAAYRQKLTEADKVIEQNQPNPAAIPQPSNQPEYAKVDEVQTMTKQAAENIVMFSNQQKRYGQPIHPQYEAAVKFLQEEARKK